MKSSSHMFVELMKLTKRVAAFAKDKHFIRAHSAWLSKLWAVGIAQGKTQCVLRPVTNVDVNELAETSSPRNSVLPVQRRYNKLIGQSE